MQTETRSPIALVAVFIAVAGFSSEAQAGAGRKLAEQKCARCHAIGEADSSPNPIAPPFRSIHRRYPVDALRQSFLRGLEVGHRDMPRFVLKPQEITDIIAYLRDLDPCGKPSSDKVAMARCFEPIEP